MHFVKFEKDSIVIPVKNAQILFTNESFNGMIAVVKAGTLSE